MRNVIRHHVLIPGVKRAGVWSEVRALVVLGQHSLSRLERALMILNGPHTGLTDAEEPVGKSIWGEICIPVKSPPPQTC